MNQYKFSVLLDMAKFRIKTILAARGLTLKALADKLGITPQTLGNIVNDKGNPNLSSLERIASALDVPVSSLFMDYLEPNPSVIICPQCGARIDIQTGTPK